MKKVHYAPSGSWGRERTNCNRYYNSDVLFTAEKSKVTCKYCCKNLKNTEKKEWIKNCLDWATKTLDAKLDFKSDTEIALGYAFKYAVAYAEKINPTTLNIENLKPDHSLKITNKGKEPIILSNGINIINGKTYICGIDSYDEDSSLGNTKSPSN